jgi:soluble P-type ATPase
MTLPERANYSLTESALSPFPAEPAQIDHTDAIFRRRLSLSEHSVWHSSTPILGDFALRRLVSDYTGTLALGGKLSPGVQDRLQRLKEILDVTVISADSFGTAVGQLASIPISSTILAQGSRHNQEKESHVKRNNPSQIAAFGNGNNDLLMLKTVKEAGGLAVAVDNGEGCSVDAVLNANIFIVNITNALDLLLEPIRLKATLRK